MNNFGNLTQVQLENSDSYDEYFKIIVDQIKKQHQQILDSWMVALHAYNYQETGICNPGGLRLVQKYIDGNICWQFEKNPDIEL